MAELKCTVYDFSTLYRRIPHEKNIIYFYYEHFFFLVFCLPLFFFFQKHVIDNCLLNKMQICSEWEPIHHSHYPQKYFEADIKSMSALPVQHVYVVL
jgi:hypothetical protein